jgi:hypothetical protein
MYLEGYPRLVSLSGTALTVSPSSSTRQNGTTVGPAQGDGDCSSWPGAEVGPDRGSGAAGLLCARYLVRFLGSDSFVSRRGTYQPDPQAHMQRSREARPSAPRLCFSTGTYHLSRQPLYNPAVSNINSSSDHSQIPTTHQRVDIPKLDGRGRVVIVFITDPAISFPCQNSFKASVRFASKAVKPNEAPSQQQLRGGDVSARLSRERLRTPNCHVQRLGMSARFPMHFDSSARPCIRSPPVSGTYLVRDLLTRLSVQLQFLCTISQEAHVD